MFARRRKASRLLGEEAMDVGPIVLIAAALTALVVCFPKELVAAAAITAVFLMIFGVVSLLAAAP
jgi:hypothetical protein